MANDNRTVITTENGEVGYLAPNVKNAILQEVEDDATYITNKRFQEHYAEQEREREKLQRQEQKQETQSVQDKKGK